MNQPDIVRKLEELGMTLKADKYGAFWFFERYVPARFDEKDENGNITLDIGFYVE